MQTQVRAQVVFGDGAGSVDFVAEDHEGHAGKFFDGEKGLIFWIS
jgi:hypothetical protein